MKNKATVVKKFAAGSLMLGALAGTASAETSGFTVLGSGAELRSLLTGSHADVNNNSYAANATEDKSDEGKCGEGKCGGAKEPTPAPSPDKSDEGKCGEGKCGGSK